MPLPRIAIVGRPNVGKSSLLNMLAGARVSIVDPTPGVTRDRVTAVVELSGPLKTEEPRLAEITDTGGYGVYTAAGAKHDDSGTDLTQLTALIESQIAAAIERADFVIFVIDAQTGVTALDQTIAGLLRKQWQSWRDRAPKIIALANKVDSEQWEAHAQEAASLGFGPPLLVSAQTGYRKRELLEHLFALLPESAERETKAPEMLLAIVGRRNAGKSSFVNALAGEERCIVSEVAGTTRDAIDVRIELDGRSLIAVDTAGLRKRARIADAVEHWAVHRCMAAIERADAALLLIDATEHITGVDKRLGAHILEHFKPCVIVVSKWDLVRGKKDRKGRPITTENYAKYIEDELPGMAICPIVFTSSKERLGLREAVGVAHDLFEQASQRVPTPQLNRAVRAIIDERGPGSPGRVRPKVLYVSQVAANPPTIVLVVNKPDLFKGQYERFLMNRLHEVLPFSEVPIRLILRERERASLSEMARAGRRRAEASGDESEARLVPEFRPPGAGAEKRKAKSEKWKSGS